MLARILPKGRRGRLDPAQRMQAGLAILGAVLLPLGLVVILLGWQGTAHHFRTWEEFSYLVSGGLFGVGLVLVGGFLYFGSWLARLAALQQQQTERMANLLEQMSAGVVAAVPEQWDGVEFVATPTGNMLHRPDCPIVANRDDLREVTPADGLKPCRLCEPLVS